MSNLQISKVLYRHVQHPFKIVSPDDFVTTEWIDLPPEEKTNLKTIIPYAIDYKNRCNIYIAKLNREQAVNAPFLYKYQRENADFIIKSPWKLGPISETQKIKIPTFIFSPGRCGSTLLSKITQKANCISFSEPDFYTQASLTKLANTDQAKIINKKNILFLTSDLLAAYDATQSDQITIKLRSESCSRPELFLFNSNQKTIFLIRHFIPWAQSVVWHFSKINPQLIEKLPSIYNGAIKCMSFLSKNSKCHILSYEEISKATEENARNLSNAFQLNITRDLLEEVLNKDSQAGTSLESKNYSLSKQQLQLIDEAYSKWLKIADQSLLKHANLAYLLETR